MITYTSIPTIQYEIELHLYNSHKYHPTVFISINSVNFSPYSPASLKYLWEITVYLEYVSIKINCMRMAILMSLNIFLIQMLITLGNFAEVCLVLKSKNFLVMTGLCLLASPIARLFGMMSYVLTKELLLRVICIQIQLPLE